MFRAFFVVIAGEFGTLFICASVIAGLTEHMSVGAAGNGLMIFAGIDIITVGVSVWGFRRLGAAWGNKVPSLWLVVPFGALSGLLGVLMLVAIVVLLNR